MPVSEKYLLTSLKFILQILSITMRFSKIPSSEYRISFIINSTYFTWQTKNNGEKLCSKILGYLRESDA
jgi:uncharacterized membrane protein